jgi:UDP-glucose 4-epimerase
MIEVGDSMQRPGAYFATNTAGTARLLDVLLRHDVGRFVFSSTAATYGEPVTVPIDEGHPNVPTNPYGESKLMTERMLAWYRRLHSLRSASLRYFNAAGATGRHGERADEHQSHLIPLVLLASAGRRDHVRVFGTDYPTPDGTAVRDYIHVADLADAHVLALDALDPGAPASRDGDAEAGTGDGRIVANLANGAGFSVREVIATAKQVTGLPVPHVDEPRRAGDPAVLVASAERARRVLGWEPRRPELTTIVGDAWTHLQEHGAGWRAERSARSEPPPSGLRRAPGRRGPPAARPGRTAASPHPAACPRARRADASRRPRGHRPGRASRGLSRTRTA